MFWIPSFSGHFSFRAIFVSVCFLLLLFLLFPLSTAGKKSRAMKRMKSTRSGREKERKKKKLCPAAREYTYVCMHVCARVYMASNFEYLWVHVRKVACTAATEKEGKGEKKTFLAPSSFFWKMGGKMLEPGWEESGAVASAGGAGVEPRGKVGLVHRFEKRRTTEKLVYSTTGRSWFAFFNIIFPPKTPWLLGRVYMRNKSAQFFCKYPEIRFHSHGEH